MKKLFNKSVGLFLAFSMVFGLAQMTALPAFAAETDSRAVIEEERVKLEEKYGITIQYDNDNQGDPCITVGSLHYLNNALEPVTPSVVKQVSSFYQNKFGNKLKFHFRFTSPDLKLDDNIQIMAMYDTETAIIEVYVPSSSKGTAMSGDSPITVLHEFAHAYFFMFAEQYGEANMEREWIAINDGVPYNKNMWVYAYNKITFMSSYGATSLEEDFAEVFSHAFLSYRDGLGFSHRLKTGERLTSLGKKIAFIEKMLPMYLSGTEQAVANLRRIHTASINIYYGGIKLAGSQLEYIGYAAPRYVLDGILGYYEITKQSATWVTEIGGWYVSGADGKYYLVFPGGYVDVLPYAINTAA